MKITFDTPKEITVVKEVKRSFSEITISEMIDSPQNKTVTAFIQEFGNIILWEGAAYDAIGQWTDQDVVNRIKEIYN